MAKSGSKKSLEPVSSTRQSVATTTATTADSARRKVSKVEQKLKWQHRLMMAAICATVLGLLFYIIALSTYSWATVRIEYVNNVTNSVYIGIWGEWIVSLDRNTNTQSKRWIPYLPDAPEDVKRLHLNHELEHFHRTAAVFAVFALLLMIVSNLLSCCTFFQVRYMYKRLAACLQLLAAVCVIIQTRVVLTSIKEWELEVQKVAAARKKVVGHVTTKPAAASGGGNAAATTSTPLDFRFDNDDYLYENTVYGYSRVLAWIAVALYVAAALIFFWCSRKRKGDEYNDASRDFDLEDRPVQL